MKWLLWLLLALLAMIWLDSCVGFKPDQHQANLSMCESRCASIALDPESYNACVDSCMSMEQK